MTVSEAERKKSDTWDQVRIYAVRCAVLLAAYVAAGKFGLSLSLINSSVSTVWPPTGLSLAALLVWGPHLWPAVFLGAFFVNLTTAGTVWTSLAIAGGNTLEAVLGAWLIARYAAGRNFLECPRNTMRFVFFGALLAPVVSATVGVSTLAAGGLLDDSFGAVWFTWWIGNAGGALTLAPLLVAWNNPLSSDAPRRSTFEMTAFWIALLGTGVLLFIVFPHRLRPHPATFFCLPAVIWAIFRLRQRGAISAAFVLCAMAVGGTIQQRGAFGSGPLEDSLVLLAFFLCVIMTTTLLFTALDRERRRLALQLSEDRNQHAFRQKILLELSRHPILHTGELQTAARHITESAASVLNVERASLWLFDETRAGIRCLDLWERGQARHSEGGYLGAADFPAYFAALEENRAIPANDALADPRTREFKHVYLEPLGIGAMLDAPLRLGGRLVGVICHEHLGGPRSWTDEEVEFAGSLADIASLTLEAAERRRAEEWLKNSLREKGILLKEVHHRVKNNLQIISSILSLQANASSDPAGARFLRDTQHRIRNMASIHERLYRTENTGWVDFCQYAAELSQTLLQAYGVDPSCLSLNTAGKIHLDSDRSVLAGMILYELVSNALKYAVGAGTSDGRSVRPFRADRPEDGIRVFLSSLSNGFIEIRVEDGGPGLPSGFRLESARSLGLTLVRALAEQLGGGVHVKSEHGVRFTVTFPGPNAVLPAKEPVTA